MDLLEAQRVEQTGVLLGLEDRLESRHRLHPEAPADAVGNGVGRVPEVRRHLHRQLTVRGQLITQPLDQRRMMRHPLQAGVGEDHVDGRRGRPLPEIAMLEPQTFARVGLGLLEHVGRRVDTERLGRADMAMQLGRQLARPTSEVDHPTAGHRGDQREQVVEGLAALGLEAAVTSQGPTCLSKPCIQV